jgi:hypothetical protein
MSLRERTRPGLGIIEPRHLPAPAGYSKSNMTASAFSRRDSAEPHTVIDLDQIPGAAEWARVVLSGAVGYGPYASFFVWFLFWYGCGAHRRCGVADRLTQHFNDRKRASLSPSCNRSDSYGRVTTALTGRERSIASKGCLSGRFHCKSGH